MDQPKSLTGSLLLYFSKLIIRHAPPYTLLTYPSSPFSTSASATLLLTAPSCSSGAGVPCASRCTVYSTSPRIIPWLTRRWNGSLVLTTPRSYSTCR